MNKNIIKDKEKKKKLVSLNGNVTAMLEILSEHTGNTENQTINMAIAFLYAQLIKK